METKKCISCGLVKSREGFYPNPRLNDGLATYCIDCTKVKVRNSVIKRRNADPITYYKKASWASLNQRSINGKYANSDSTKTSPQFISYHSKGILLAITKEELFKFWDDNRDIALAILANDDVPTIDRIDDKGNYELSNIQILSRTENIHKSRGFNRDSQEIDKETIKERNHKRYIQAKGSRIMNELTELNEYFRSKGHNFIILEKESHEYWIKYTIEIGANGDRLVLIIQEKTSQANAWFLLNHNNDFVTLLETDCDSIDFYEAIDFIIKNHDKAYEIYSEMRLPKIIGEWGYWGYKHDL